MRHARSGMLMAGVLLLAACAESTPTSSIGPSTSASESAAPSQVPSPEATVAGAHPALVIQLGFDAAPIDVITAFGSTWVANHHADTVTRIDPVTGAVDVTIALRAHTSFPGPAWFALTDDAIWVTRQNEAGMARIDPATDEPDPLQVGTKAPCGSPAVGLGSMWYWACDSAEMVRIDLATLEASSVAARGLSPPIVVDDTLYAVGQTGIVRLADDESTWEPVGGCCGYPLGYAGGTFWLADTDAVHRVDLSGAVVATIPLPAVGTMSAGTEVAWLTPGEGHSGPLQQVRLADNAILDELPVSRSPTVVRVDGDTLWVTDYNESELWRIDIGE